MFCTEEKAQQVASVLIRITKGNILHMNVDLFLYKLKMLSTNWTSISVLRQKQNACAYNSQHSIYVPFSSYGNFHRWLKLCKGVRKANMLLVYSSLMQIPPMLAMHLKFCTLYFKKFHIVKLFIDLSSNSTDITKYWCLSMHERLQTWKSVAKLGSI